MTFARKDGNRCFLLFDFPTLAARNLQAAKLIKYRRGIIQVVDVEALQEAACECHEAVRAQAARMIPAVEIASGP